jgi:hypothetical protein
MAWPYSRLTTYAPNSQVKSADLNAIQDWIIEMNRKHRTTAADGSWVTTGTATKLATGEVSSFTDGTKLQVPLRVRTADVIKAVRARVKDAVATSSVSIEVYRVVDGVRTSLGSATSASSGAWQTITRTLSTPETVADDPTKVYLVEVTYRTGDASTQYVQSIEVDCL